MTIFLESKTTLTNANETIHLCPNMIYAGLLQKTKTKIYVT